MEKHINEFLDELREDIAKKGLTQDILDDILADDPDDPSGYQAYLLSRENASR